jgi:hypothetical protein
VTTVVQELKTLASVDVFKEGRAEDSFIGRPFYFDYSKVKVLVNDKWKHVTGGVPAGCFLLAAYDGEVGVEEMVLLRVTGPTSLPSDSDVVASMCEYYKEGIETSGAATKLDSFTRYEFMFSGIECRVLGTFYRDDSGETVFGADVENFYSAHNYAVYKPSGKVLEYIVNFREGDGIPGGPGQVRIGKVRYSSARRQAAAFEVPVYVSAFDFVGKRTALFGMTRTGKSNTVKKIVEATTELGKSGTKLGDEPLKPIGQIIFDINGEYANPNQQDEGTAIYELYAGDTVRYSLLEKSGFEVMKLNFHKGIEAGFGLLSSLLAGKNDSIYVTSFLSIDLSAPDATDVAARTRWERVVAAYQATLHQAGFKLGGQTIKFQGNKDLNALAGGLDPSSGLTGDEAVTWFSAIWDSYDSNAYFQTYRQTKGREWADEDLKAVLTMLTRKTKPGGAANVAGFRLLRDMAQYHSATTGPSFEADILAHLRAGKIVIIDLSQGDPSVQRTYSERICRHVFNEAMDQFIRNESPNYIQFYFEEAHNLFPKRDEADLTMIYNRLAKEGAKLRLGLAYATQEVSSISANVLKNTQNWFVSHLNNRDELREVQKYYDFEDFVESLRMAPDRGFIRMKTYSNAFIVPVQIDRFTATKPVEVS